MSNNNIDALREHLFGALAGLKDGSVDIEKAKAISGVAQVIINTAKVEVEYAKATGQGGSAFLAPKPDLPPGITGVTQHRIR
nr:hypothetical protein [uncultured Duganella sp.]